MHVGNSTPCGYFTAQLVNISSSGVPKVLIYYNGIYTNQYILGTNGNNGYTGMGVRNITKLNVSGTSLYVWLGGVSVPYQTVYIEMTTSPSPLFATTIITTTPKTTSTTTTNATTTI